MLLVINLKNIIKVRLINEQINKILYLNFNVQI